MPVKFESPGFLVVLLLAVVAGVGLVIQHRERRRAIDEFASADLQPWMVPVRSANRRLAVGGSLVLAAVLLLVAAARPSRAVDVPFELSTVVVALDASRSMGAR